VGLAGGFRSAGHRQDHGLGTLGLYSMARELALLPGSDRGTPDKHRGDARGSLPGSAPDRGDRLAGAARMALVADETAAELLDPIWLPAAPVLRLVCVYVRVRAINVLARVLFARCRERCLFGYFLAVDCGASRGCRRRAVVRGDRCSRVLEADVLPR
jgi:hypothetical protein